MILIVRDKQSEYVVHGPIKVTKRWQPKPSWKIKESRSWELQKD